MRTRNLSIGMALALAFLATGCAFQKPTLKFKSARIADTDLEGTTLNLTYTLKNPNPLGISLASVSYGLQVEGHQVVAGKPRNGLQVAANKSQDLTFPARVRFQDIAPVVQVFLNQDQARYRASGTVGINTPLGVIELPLSHDGVFPIPKIPSFAFQTPTIRNLSLTGASIVFPIQITNRNTFPLPVGGFTANLQIAGAPVGNAAASMPPTLSAGEAKVVELPVNVNFLQVGMAVYNALQSRTAAVKLDGAFKSGGLSLPISMAQNLSFR